jgi:CHAT domain
MPAAGGLRARVGPTIALPARDGEPVVIRDASGAEERIPVSAPPPEDRADALWGRLRDDWSGRRRILDETSRRLGDWMLGERGARAIADAVQGWRADGEPRCVILDVPERLEGWPWESASRPELSSALAVDPGLALVRRGGRGGKAEAGPASARRLALVCVDHDPARVPRESLLRTGDELQRVLVELKNLPADQSVDVEDYALGAWSQFRQRIDEVGPPDVFHFAGHAFGAGDGLVFRGDDGGAEEVSAAQMKAILADDRRSRCTLAVLNACRTLAAGLGRSPFGSLGRRLVDLGIPSVVGVQAPLVDDDGSRFAGELYRRLARGDAVDVAVQAARRELFLHESEPAAWAFITLVAAGSSRPVFDRRAALPPVRPEIFDEFAFTEQRNELRRLLGGGGSLAVVVHGKLRNGHRYLIDQVHKDVGRKGHVVWQPVPTLRWCSTGEPMLEATAMLGAIASALSLDPVGENDELETRVAEQIRRCCAQNRALVLDMVDVCVPTSKHEADGLVELVDGVWRRIAERVGRDTSFLLLSIAYPPDGRRASHARKAVSRLARARARKGEVHLRIKVLDELKPITERWVACYLHDALKLDPTDAGRKAISLTRGRDNELLLDDMKRLIESRWTT